MNENLSCAFGGHWWSDVFHPHPFWVRCLCQLSQSDGLACVIMGHISLDSVINDCSILVMGTLTMIDVTLPKMLLTHSEVVLVDFMTNCVSLFFLSSCFLHQPTTTNLFFIFISASELSWHPATKGKTTFKFYTNAKSRHTWSDISLFVRCHCVWFLDLCLPSSQHKPHTKTTFFPFQI